MAVTSNIKGGESVLKGFGIPVVLIQQLGDKGITTKVGINTIAFIDGGTCLYSCNTEFLLGNLLKGKVAATTIHEWSTHLRNVIKKIVLGESVEDYPLKPHGAPNNATVIGVDLAASSDSSSTTSFFVGNGTMKQGANTGVIPQDELVPPTKTAKKEKVHLKHAFMLYQPVHGTSTDSTYCTIALSSTGVAVAMRAEPASKAISIRVQKGSVSIHEAMVSMGFSSKGEYYSLHTHVDDTFHLTMVLGSVLMAIPVSWNTNPPEISKIFQTCTGKY